MVFYGREGRKKEGRDKLCSRELWGNEELILFSAQGRLIAEGCSRVRRLIDEDRRKWHQGKITSVQGLRVNKPELLEENKKHTHMECLGCTGSKAGRNQMDLNVLHDFGWSLKGTILSDMWVRQLSLGFTIGIMNWRKNLEQVSRPLLPENFKKHFNIFKNLWTVQVSEQFIFSFVTISLRYDWHKKNPLDV